MSGWFFIIIIIIIIIIVAHEIGPGFSVPVRSAPRRWVCGSLRGQMLFAEALFFSFFFFFSFSRFFLQNTGKGNQILVNNKR